MGGASNSIGRISLLLSVHGTQGETQYSSPSPNWQVPLPQNAIQATQHQFHISATGGQSVWGINLAYKVRQVVPLEQFCASFQKERKRVWSLVSLRNALSSNLLLYHRKERHWVGPSLYLLTIKHYVKLVPW